MTTIRTTQTAPPPTVETPKFPHGPCEAPGHDSGIRQGARFTYRGVRMCTECCMKAVFDPKSTDMASAVCTESPQVKRL